MHDGGALPLWLESGLSAVLAEHGHKHIALLVELDAEVLRGEGAEESPTASGSVRPPGQHTDGSVRASVVDGHLVIEIANVQPTASPWLVIEGIQPIPLEMFEGTLQAVVPLSSIDRATGRNPAQDTLGRIGLIWPA